jgi:hypothetical protein
MSGPVGDWAGGPGSVGGGGGYIWKGKKPSGHR